MAAEAVLAIIIVVFIAGALVGCGLLVSWASRREDNARLSREAPGRMTQAGRYVTGLRVTGPDSHRAWRRYPDDSQAELGRGGGLPARRGRDGGAGTAGRT